MASFGAFAKRLFGSSNDRRIKAYKARVEAINALEPELAQLDDAALRGKTAEFRARLEAGAALDDLLPEAFATVREAAGVLLGLLCVGLLLREGGVRGILGWDLVLAVLMQAAPAKAFTNIRSDESIIFFTTAARVSPDGSQWVVPVHAWVFEKEGDSLWRRGALEWE